MEREAKDLKCVSNCGWCCNNVNVPIPTNDLFTLDRMLELLLLQGHKVYKEPSEGQWYVIINKPCVHYDTDTCKCRIYNTSRAELCRIWTCHDPGNMIEYYDKLTKEGEEEYANSIL